MSRGSFCTAKLRQNIGFYKLAGNICNKISLYILPENFFLVGDYFDAKFFYHVGG